MDGRMMTISISNTKNKTARRKNRRENGSRALLRGMRPHSNEEESSRFLWGPLVGQLREGAESIRARGIRREMDRGIMSFIILLLS